MGARAKALAPDSGLTTPDLRLLSSGRASWQLALRAPPQRPIMFVMFGQNPFFPAFCGDPRAGQLSHFPQGAKSPHRLAVRPVNGGSLLDRVGVCSVNGSSPVGRCSCTERTATHFVDLSAAKRPFGGRRPVVLQGLQYIVQVIRRVMGLPRPVESIVQRVNVGPQHIVKLARHHGMRPIQKTSDVVTGLRADDRLPLFVTGQCNGERVMITHSNTPLANPDRAPIWRSNSLSLRRSMKPETNRNAIQIANDVSRRPQPTWPRTHSTAAWPGCGWQPRPGTPRRRGPLATMAPADASCQAECLSRRQKRSAPISTASMMMS